MRQSKSHNLHKKLFFVFDFNLQVHSVYIDVNI